MIHALVLVYFVIKRACNTASRNTKRTLNLLALLLYKKTYLVFGARSRET